MKRAALVSGLLLLAFIWGGPLFAVDERTARSAASGSR
jgi:hypothetical protein